MRIIIIVPNTKFSGKALYSEYPLGAGYVGTALEDHGHSVTIIDQAPEGFSDEEVVEYIYNEKADCILFSMVTSTYTRGLNILNLLKKNNPHIMTIAGGVHPTLFPKQTLQDGFSFVNLGEGELSTPQLINAYFSGNDYKNINGICYYDENTKNIIINNQQSPVPFNIVVNRNLYNLSLYKYHTVMFSRGCPYGCRFCCDIFRSLGKQYIRSTTKECIEKELDYINRLGGDIFFADDIFMEHKKNLDFFYKLYVDKRYSFGWVAQMRADTVSEDRVAAMAECGCKRIYIGCEAGSDNILYTAGKRTTSTAIEKAVKILHKYKIPVKTGWIYGLPGSINEQYKSIDLMLKTMPQSISIHQLIPFPGTYFFNNRYKFGITIDNPYNFDLYAYSGINYSIQYSYLPPKELEKLFIYTENKLQEAGYISSDKATKKDRYVYTTPINIKPIEVFR